MCSTLARWCCFTLKCQTILEALFSGKHSSLLQSSINYDRKMFYSTGPQGDLNKDPNVWLDGAGPPQISLIISLTNS